jgi:hypothetical protein
MTEIATRIRRTAASPRGVAGLVAARGAFVSPPTWEGGATLVVPGRLVASLELPDGLFVS